MKKIFFLLTTVFLMTSTLYFAPKTFAAENISIQDVYTDKSRYEPGETVTITIEITNGTSTAYSGDVSLHITHLDSEAHSDQQSITTQAGETLQVDFYWTVPMNDFKGYFVEVAYNQASDSTAIDVSSDWTKYPRYGYLSTFSSNETIQESIEKVNKLSRDYHINAWQLYDWMWRHDNFIKRTGGTIDSTWIDLFDREISWDTIQNQIQAIHNVNGNAMAYAMGYASRENYSQFGIDPKWGIYEDSIASNQFDVDFQNGKYLYLFDPENSSWQNYMNQQYLDIVNAGNFDGIHIDQMGQRENVYNYSGNSIDLSKRFSSFINSSKNTLSSNNTRKDNVTFNIVDGTVDGWAAKDIATNSDADFLYSEIWFKSQNYNDIKNYVEQLKRVSNDKAVVLAAYMNYKENSGPRYEAEDAVLTNVMVDSDHPGYTGTGFVDQFDEVGDQVEFTINAPEDGEYSLVFRFANNTSDNSTRTLYVDGVEETEIDFAKFNSWDTWSHDNYYTLSLSQGNHTITLSFDLENQGAINLDSLTLGTFDKNSILLADAAFAASGATHIELGDNNHMLAHEYYPNTSKKMRNDLKNTLSDYYSFITAYENLLFDQDVTPNDTGNQFIKIDDETTSGNGLGDTIWNIQKRTQDYNIYHLINLSNNDSEWRNSGNTPDIKNNLSTKIYIGGKENISNVYLASPDINHGKSQELTFTSGKDVNGKYVSFTVPSLEYWNMIYMKRSFNNPVNDIYEAEDEILSNVGTNTNHSGYTGTGFVDQFVDTNDGVSFIVNTLQDEDYVLRYKYSNGGSQATREVYIDGQYTGTISFENTGGWDQWQYGELTTHLDPGVHTIILWYSSNNTGAINLDHLDLDKTYIWQFDRQITSVPDGYRITFRTGQQGWVHWGTNGWQNTIDTKLENNGSFNQTLDFETSIGPFQTGDLIDFTFLWDDNLNGQAEYEVDRWEGQDFKISIN
ncbi:glycoside hydrolase family 66 protein [Bacillaceae bacterium S4-13-58]